MASRASTSSPTTMVPISAAMDAPAKPTITMAAISGPSSRNTETPTRLATLSVWPYCSRVGDVCSARMIPIDPLTSITMEMDRTPTRTSCDVMAPLPMRTRRSTNARHIHSPVSRPSQKSDPTKSKIDIQKSIQLSSSRIGALGATVAVDSDCSAMGSESEGCFEGWSHLEDVGESGNFKDAADALVRSCENKRASSALA